MKRYLLWMPLALLPFWSACGYNQVIELDEDVKASWSEVENQYQRRAELIPNLVQTVKGASSFEQKTLKDIVEARSKVGSIQADASILDNPQRFAAFEQAQNQLSGALQRLLVVVERYPDLKATGAYRDLMTQLEGTENRITVARRRYIETVAEYNKVVLRFPTSIGASLRGKKVRPTFSTNIKGADRAPKVEF